MSYKLYFSNMVLHMVVKNLNIHCKFYNQVSTHKNDKSQVTWNMTALEKSFTTSTM